MTGSNERLMMSNTEHKSSMAKPAAPPIDDFIVQSLEARYSRLTSVLRLYDDIPPPNGAEESLPPVDVKKRYRLAVTDLFVETALDLLQKKADIYQARGYWAYALGVLVIFAGISVASIQMFNFRPLLPTQAFQHSVAAVLPAIAPSSASAPSGTASKAIVQSPQYPAEPSPWIDLLSRFIRAFTFYGLIVLAAVKIWQFGKAMLDQSERLFERRHALRQGRLFAHLNDGKISIEQLERAFAWNLDQPNAFANIVTDAKAPWGAASAEFTKILPELLKIGADSARRNN